MQSGQRGTFMLLMGHLALHIRDLIATAEPENCPRETFLIAPEGAQSKTVGIRGPEGGALAPPEFQHPESALFLRLKV